VVDAQLSFKVNGRLVERLVDEGDEVKAGQVIGRLDDVELRHQLDARRADLRATEAMLAELKAGSRPEEIATSEAGLRSAEAQLNRAKLEYQRREELRASDSISVREFETAEADLQVAKAVVEEATARLALVREGPRKEAIDQAAARVSQAEAAAALAESQLANTILTAPFDGVVLEKHAEPGEFLGPGGPVLTVADTSTVWVRAYLNQTDLGRAKLGQNVEVRTDSFPGKTYRGKLSFISSEAEFTPKSVQTTKERVTLVFRIKIELDNSSGELKPGMAADATL
jgi:HlyD family secretion protein